MVDALTAAASSPIHLGGGPHVLLTVPQTSWVSGTISCLVATALIRSLRTRNPQIAMIWPGE
jgi:hypothetical protein